MFCVSYTRLMSPFAHTHSNISTQLSHKQNETFAQSCSIFFILVPLEKLFSTATYKHLYARKIHAILQFERSKKECFNSNEREDGKVNCVEIVTIFSFLFRFRWDFARVALHTPAI